MARRIDDATIQAVRDAVDIAAVAGDYTKLERAGRGYKGLSPFRKEKTPSFTIDPEKGLYYCFSSGVGGDAIHLHMQMTGDDFLEAIESLAVRFGIPLPERAAGSTGGGQRGPDSRAALEQGLAFFRHHLSKSPGAQGYLEGRRIAPELIDRFGLGYAPDSWDALLGALRKRVAVRDLEAVGLIGTSRKTGKLYDRFRHRLMFPIHAGSGRLVGFGGRTLGDDKAKYVNTSETAVFHKGRLLYGLHQAKRALRDTGRAILVEGYTDVIGTIAAGVEGAVAGMGTALTPEQAKQLAQFVDEVVVAYDGDEAGERAFARALPILLAEGMSVRRARLGAGLDPDSLRIERGDQAVVDAIEQAEDAVWLLIRRAIPDGDPSPVEQERAATQIAEIVRLVRDPIARNLYVKRAAEALGVQHHLISARLAGNQRPLLPVEATKDPSSYPKHEDRALLLLLDAATTLPPTDAMPSPEIFFDEACRNIYQAFCACYESAGGAAPTSTAVLAHLREGGVNLDAAARILLASPVLDEEGSSETTPPAETELSEILGNLEKRWAKQRAVALHQQIKQALSTGDLERAHELRDEKNALTRNLHPDATGTL